MGAVEAYTRLGLVSMDPEKNYKKKKRFRRDSTKKHIDYLAHAIVEKAGNGESHPFTSMFRQHFPRKYKYLQQSLPRKYPDPTAAGKMVRAVMDRKAKIYLGEVQTKKREQERLLQKRSIISKAIRRRKYASMYWKTLPPTTLAAMWDRDGVSQSEEVQTEEVRISSADMQENFTDMETPLMLCRSVQTVAATVEITGSIDNDENAKPPEVMTPRIPRPDEDIIWCRYPVPVPGQVHPNVEQLFRGSAEEALHPVTINS